jgi:hypothetical protein
MSPRSGYSADILAAIEPIADPLRAAETRGYLLDTDAPGGDRDKVRKLWQAVCRTARRPFVAVRTSIVCDEPLQQTDPTSLVQTWMMLSDGWQITVHRTRTSGPILAWMMLAGESVPTGVNWRETGAPLRAGRCVYTGQTTSGILYVPPIQEAIWHGFEENARTIWRDILKPIPYRPKNYHRKALLHE